MFEQLNRNIFTAINHFAGNSKILDILGIAAAKYLPFFFIIVLIYLWFKEDENKPIALDALYSAVLGLLLNYIITRIYFHPRPFMIPMGNLLISHTNDASFPSDHTTLMLSMAFLLFYFRKTRIIGAILFFLGLAGGISRVFCGLHFPFDILGSMIVGSVSAGIIYMLKGSLQKVNIIIITFYDRIISPFKKNRE